MVDFFYTLLSLVVDQTNQYFFCTKCVQVASRCENFDVVADVTYDSATVYVTTHSASRNGTELGIFHS